jgi:putative membrane protein
MWLTVRPDWGGGIRDSAAHECGFPPTQIRAHPDINGIRQGYPQTVYWDHMTGWGWAMMSFWSLLWIMLVVGLVWAVVQWSRGSGPTPPAPESGKSAREVLDQRLASGEIDIDEYQARRAALEPREPVGTHS